MRNRTRNRLWSDINDVAQRFHTGIGNLQKISACKDEQTAADLKIEGVSRGAFSYALQSVLREEPGIRIADCEDRVLERVKTVSSHKQEPQYYYVEPNARVLG